MDAIRAAAAFVVLACHARLLLFGEHRNFNLAPAADLKHAAAPPALGLGHHAVIVFFVLSGFLVGNSVWRAMRANRWSWGKYLLQRMTRLWIVLLPALLVGCCLDHLGMRYLAHSGALYSSPHGQPMLSDGLAPRSTLKVLAANAVFLQGMYAPTYGTNAALWSLTNEFWYYMAFPPLLIAIVGRGARRRLASLALAVVILLFIAKIAALFVVWLLGFVVSVLPLVLAPKLRRAGTAVCMIQFLCVNGLLRAGHLPELASSLLLGFSFALLLYVIAHHRQPIGSLAYQHLVTRLSSFSYTLYLVHLPFLTFTVGSFLRPWHPWSKDALHLALAAAVVGLTYLYAYAFYLLFERRTDRLRRTLSRFTLPGKAPTPGAAQATPAG